MRSGINMQCLVRDDGIGWITRIPRPVLSANDTLVLALMLVDDGRKGHSRI